MIKEEALAKAARARELGDSDLELGFLRKAKELTNARNYWQRALNNTPEDAKNFAHGMLNTLKHPVDSAQSLLNLANGAFQHLLPETINNLMPESTRGNKEIASNVASDFGNTFGSLDKFNESFAEKPIDTLSKVSLIAGIPSSILKTGSIAAKAVNAPKAAARLSKNATTAANFANLANPTNLPLKAAGYAAKAITAPIQATSGVLTGLGYDKLNKYTEDGLLGKTGTLDAIRGKLKVEEFVPRMQVALDSASKEMHKIYAKDILPTSNDKTILSMKPILKEYADLSKMAYRKMSGGKFSKGEDATNNISNLRLKIKDFLQKSEGKPNAMDLDALKQVVYDVGMKPYKSGTLEYKIGSNLYNKIKQTIKDQAPDYANVMSNFTDSIEEIKNIQHITSIGKDKIPAKSYNKLYSLAKAKTEGRHGSSIRLVDKLSKYDPDLLNDLSGIAGHEWGGRFTASGGGMAALASYLLSNPAIVIGGIASTSPRLAAETAYKIGSLKRIGGPTKKAANALSLIQSLIEQEKLSEKLGSSFAEQSANYGQRPNGTNKGTGYLGELQMQDGSGDVATEMTIGVNFDGKETDIPAIVPTLSREQIEYITKGGDINKRKDIIQKAVDHAKKRMKDGLSPYAN